MIAHSKQQSPQAQLKTPDEKIDEENDNWMAFSQLNEIQLKDESKIWIESLSQEEREAVGWYVDSSVFINAAFRLGGGEIWIMLKNSRGICGVKTITMKTFDPMIQRFGPSEK